MERLVIFALVGLGAQLVDGTLGMAFGVTATTLFVLSGTGAATASAVVHLAEVGTTLASGVAHWRHGNVDRRLLLLLGAPGAAGALAGATVLAHLDAAAAAPVVAAILLCLGLRVLAAHAAPRGRRRVARPAARGRRLVPLGLAAGLLDATGGGGWGPMTASVLLGAGGGRARTVVGTVSAAEFLVAAASTLGFLPLLRDQLAAHAGPVAAMLAGGVVAAPVAARLVGRADPRLLGIAVGGVLVGLNARVLLAPHAPPGATASVLAAWTVAVAAMLLRVRRRGAPGSRGRRGRAGVPAPRTCNRQDSLSSLAAATK